MCLCAEQICWTFHMHAHTRTHTSAHTLSYPEFSGDGVGLWEAEAVLVEADVGQGGEET